MCVYLRAVNTSFCKTLLQLNPAPQNASDNGRVKSNLNGSERLLDGLCKVLKGVDEGFRVQKGSENRSSP